MCVTIYGTTSDFRKAMRNPNDPNRVHATCRRLTGCLQKSHWYGAFYWAGCAAFRDDEPFEQYRRRFLVEMTGSSDGPFPEAYRKLWDLAVRRVVAIREEARRLKSSVLW